MRIAFDVIGRLLQPCYPNGMKILILGGDGYLGWPTVMHFAGRGHEVAVVDNLSKRFWEAETGSAPLFLIPSLQRRVRLWNEHHPDGAPLRLYIGDIAHNYRFIYDVFEGFRPDAIVHYAEQPSAPYSMHSRQRAVATQINNIAGTLHVLFAMKRFTPDAALVKLGTMGEYGTPNIDIEEGWLDVEYKGRKDRMLFPKQAGSFYHLSKVHDSHNIEFACRVWGLRATDLNQGVVYGMETDETERHAEFLTSFHYDEVFGTALNRFIVQAAADMPLTVYGAGGQTRGWLNIRDTIQCVALAVLHPPKAGEFRVFNQFTEIFSVADLAQKVKEAGESLGLAVAIAAVENPRVEKEKHYYNPHNSALVALGLRHHPLTREVIAAMLRRIITHRKHIDASVIHPTIKWRQK